MTDKSVIFLFLHGGPSQIETFDPKMSAPAEVRSATGEVATKLPGVTFGGTFPKLARLADKLAIVRSYVRRRRQPRHQAGRRPRHLRRQPRLHLRPRRRHESPRHRHAHQRLLFPRAVDPGDAGGHHDLRQVRRHWPLRRGLAPFAPGGGGSLQKDMQLKLALDRLDDRRRLLASLDRALAIDAAERAASTASARQGVSHHPRRRRRRLRPVERGPKTLARYDTAPLVRPENIDKKWKNYNNYVDNAKSLGKLLLLARRLCERGCGFVTVTTNFVWDMHADVNNARVAEGMRYMGQPLDHAVSAFLEDLEARGLSDKILLVVLRRDGPDAEDQQERRPRSLGQPRPAAVGRRRAEDGPGHRPVEPPRRRAGHRPVRIKNLIATIMHTLFDAGQLRVMPGLPRELARVLDWRRSPACTPSSWRLSGARSAAE